MKLYITKDRLDKKIILAFTISAYTLIFLVFYEILKRGVGALAILPVTFIAWYYGTKAGVIAALLSLPFNILFLNLLGDEGINTYIARAGGVAGTLALILIGGVVGRLSELSKQVKQELAERKKAEDMLRATSQTLMALIQESPLAIIVLDLTGIITLWNPAAERTFGWGEKEIVGQVLAFIEPEARDEFWQKIRAVFQGITVKDIEMQHKRRDGRLIDTTVSAAPLHDEAGTVNGIMMIIADITQQKRLQQEILAVSGREQRRIGQDLHDGLGQALTGIGFLSRTLEKRLSSKSFPEAQDAGVITRLVNEAIGQTRGLARGLYPVTLETDGLMAAIEELAATTENRYAVACKFICDKPVAVKDSLTAIHLYRIVQEAVANAIRHAGPRHIIISLDIEDGRCILTVRDDGTGIDPAERHGHGMGINLMRYRAKIIGASLEVQSAAGKGTSIICAFHTNPQASQCEKDNAGE